MTTVIHVDTERTWRGGEGQVFHLVRGLPDHGFSSVIAAPAKSALMDKARTENIPVIALRSTGEISPRQCMDLLRGAKRFKAALFHVHTSHGLISAALAARFLKHKPKIVYSRRTDFHLRTGFLNLSLNKYRWCPDTIISVSDGIKRILVSDGLSPDNITTIHSGIALDSFNPDDDGLSVRTELGIGPSSVVIGKVAALAPHKDPFTFLKAAEKIAARFPDTVFLMVGAGSMWNDLETAVKVSTIADRFIMTGFRCDIPRILAAIDIFCMTSQEEGLGTSILDAMAMRKPVVATCAGGIPEVVQDGCTGFLAPVHDADVIAEKLALLISNPDLRHEMGLAGSHRVRDKFDVRNTVARTAAKYRELLSDV